MKDGVNALEEVLFRELEALQATDSKDKEAVAAAVARANAVVGVAKAVNENHRVALEASELAGAKTRVQLPRIGSGDGEGK